MTGRQGSVALATTAGQILKVLPGCKVSQQAGVMAKKTKVLVHSLQQKHAVCSQQLGAHVESEFNGTAGPGEKACHLDQAKHSAPNDGKGPAAGTGHS